MYKSTFKIIEEFMLKEMKDSAHDYLHIYRVTNQAMEIAYDFLIGIGWSSEDALHVKECIQSHRYRIENPPKTVEAKILFDSDKLDSTGAIGIARTLNYGGIMNEPLYTVDENMIVHEGTDEAPKSFIKEYNFKLIKLYDGFYTEKAKILPIREKVFLRNFIIR